MLLSMFFLSFWVNPIVGHPIEPDTISVTGKMWDISSGQDLKLVDAGGVGSQLQNEGSGSSALFDLQIPSSLRNLVFRAEGYRTRTIPVNIIDKNKSGQKFSLSIPMILLDSEQVVTRSYLVDKTPVPDSIDCDPAMGKVYFEVVDASNGQVINGRVCITSALTGHMKCVDTEKGKASVLWLNENDTMGAGVNADGYDFFGGTLTKAKFRGKELLFRFKLLKSINQIVESYVNVPRPPEITVDVRNLRTNSFTEFTKLPGETMPSSLNSQSVPGEYQITMTGADGVAIRQERFNVGPGITLKYFDFLKKEPLKKSPAKNATSTETPLAEAKKPESVNLSPQTLYFDQSSYILRKETQQTLDSVAKILREKKSIKAHVIGYTDAVGRKDLNRLLSENRAIVVNNYLKEKGVSPSQIFYIGKGNDGTAAAGDSEESRSKNRRVEIQFVEQ